MEPTTPADQAAKGHRIVAQDGTVYIPVHERSTASDRRRQLAVAIEKPDGSFEYAALALWCQECGALVTGPQYRNHKRGDVVRLIGPHEVRPEGKARAILPEGKEVTIEAINDDGSYTVVAYTGVFGEPKPVVVKLSVWPGETEEEPVRTVRKRKASLTPGPVYVPRETGKTGKPEEETGKP